MASEIRVNKQTNRVGLGTVTYTDTGIIVSGIVTANSFKGDGSQLTGVDSTALKDTAGNVKVQANSSGIVITGVTTTGAVSWGGHMLPTSNAAYDIGSADYKVRHLFLSDNSLKFVDSSDTEHPLSVDSGRLKFAGGLLLGNTIKVDEVSGIITATSINVGSGITLSSDGNAFHTGIVTATSVAASGVDLTGLLKEDVNIIAGRLSNNTNIDLENGMVHYFTTQETQLSTPNIRFSSSESLNSKMSIGESISVTIITTAGSSAYSEHITIDNSGVTENWVGGEAPSDGGSSGVDIYSYTIIKTANATFTVIANQNKTSS